MKKLILLASVLGMGLLSLAAARPAISGSVPPDKIPQVRSTMALKTTMAKFGSMLAGLEILRLKEKTPDWEAINLTLKELSQTLGEMQKADENKVYKEYTDVLAGGLVELQAEAQSKSKKFFKSVDKLTDTCFRCHAAHRPGDYLIPKDGQKLSGQ